MNKLKVLPLALLLLSFGAAGCAGTEGGDAPAESKGGAAQTSEPSSPIKSLVATVTSLELKYDEATSVSAYYKLTGYKSLSSKEKKVKITSSDPTSVKIVGAIMTGIKVGGTSTITITSDADSTKSCSFEVLVKDIFFNRKYSEISGEDDLSQELPSDGGMIKTLGGTSDILIFNQPMSTHFMVSTKIAVNSVSEGELWPKFGFVFKQLNEDDELDTNFIHVFLDGPMNRIEGNVNHWTDFGYCEVSNYVYAWESGFNPAVARHKENVFIKETSINYEEFFTLTAVVDGRKIHMFLGYGEGEAAKEVYMFTLDAYADLFGEGEGRGFIPGLFQFKSIVTYKDYSYTTDADAIAAKMEGVTVRYADYDSSTHNGEIYHEVEPE